MRGRINARGLRILITMMVCLVTFKVATIVSNADSLPGVEYRACVAGNEWTKWSRNQETCGDITGQKKLEAIKLILTDTVDGAINYKVYLAGKGWTDIVNNGVTVGGTEGIQGIKIALDGDIAQQYYVCYRVHMVGGNWTKWVTDGKVAGDISGTAPIDAMEVVLTDKNGNVVISDATDYSADLQTSGEGQTVEIQETKVARNSTPSATTNAGASTGGSADASKQENVVQQPNTTTENASTQQPSTTTESVTTQQPSITQETTTDNSAQLIEKMIKIAVAEKGYKQQSDGRTKYGEWWANRVADNAFQNAKWSSMFLAWVGDQAGLTQEQYGYFAYSDYWKNWFKDNGAYHVVQGYTPKKGDMVFMDYDNDGESNHNALVTEVTSDKIKVIEGNVNGETKECEYQLNDETLLGYGTPLYNKVSTTQNNDSNNTVSQQPSGSVQQPTGNSGGTANPGYSISSLTKLSAPIEGIDVSAFNTITDWSQVAQSQKFAYVRVGLRKTNGSLSQDSKFVNNIQGAINAGIDVGVYFYTQAITTQEAVEEANFVIERIKNYKIKYPVVIDSEKSPSGTRTDALSKTQRTDIMKAFMDRIVQAGYKAQIYASKSYFSDKFNIDSISDCDKWVAHYYKSRSSSQGTDFRYPYSVWQYSDQGTVAGIKGAVDKNLCYVQY